MPTYIPIPDDQSSTKLADWLEITALVDSDGSASIQDLIYPLSSQSDEEDGNVISQDAEDKIAEAMREIGKRINSAKGNYPFKVKRDKLILKSSYKKYLPYIFCLLISYFGVEKDEYVPEWKTRKTTKQFEHLSACATQNLFESKKCKLTVKIFGFPRESTDPNLEANFVTALKKLCDDCGEMKPDTITTANRRKDAGLDIVAWKKFPDNLIGSIFFWGQCAAGNDWRDKLYGIESFSHFVNHPTQHIKGLFIPHTVEIPHNDPDYWSSLTREGGMLLDRCRIAYLTELQETKIKTELDNFIHKALIGIQNENSALYS